MDWEHTKTQQSAVNVVAAVVWDAQSIIYIHYLVKGKSDYYIDGRNRKKRPHMKKIIFHQDIVPQFE